jgi:uncharacterized membrane protein
MVETDSRRPVRRPDAASRQAAASAYFLVALSGFLVLAWKRDSGFVRFHALQSIVGTFAFVGLGLVLKLLAYFPIIGFLYAYLFHIYLVGLFVFWLFLMVKAFRGERYRIPYLGAIVERQVG